MWQVRLIGPRESLERLVAAYADRDVNIFFDGEDGVLTAVLLEQLTQPLTVVERAKALIEQLSGILSLETDFEPVRVGSLNRIEAGKKHAYAIGAPLRAASAVLSGTGVVQDSTGALKQNKEDRTSLLRALAATDPAVKDFLERHASHAHDWAGLYKLYEVIRNDMGSEQALYDKGWTTRAERSSFTNTADNSHASGHAARHAASRTAPPASPMLLDDAKRLIRQLGASWLDHKLTRASATTATAHGPTGCI